MRLLEELLPARFSGIRPTGDPASGTNSVEFDNLVLQTGATRSRSYNGTHLLTPGPVVDAPAWLTGETKLNPRRPGPGRGGASRLGGGQC